MISKLPWKILEYTSKSTKQKIQVNKNILNIGCTLINGQAFSWHPYIEDPKSTNLDTKADPQAFHGVFRKYYVQFKTDDKGLINYRSIPEDENLATQFHDYFQFDYDYEKLVEEWNKCDKHFREIAGSFRGLRIMRQDPFECLIEFICSQNNNIPRITKLIRSICEKYGEKIHEENGEIFYKFPTLESMKKADEATLREMGFGYRARYICACMEEIDKKGGENWLVGLRGKSYEEIHKELISLMGVGKKVADCIALFSLDCKNSIPVDTHVYQIFNKNYGKNNGKKEALTDKKYYEISQFFQERFGEYAGWAHSFLFTADLARFKDKVVKEVVKEEIEHKADKEKDTKKTSKKVVKNTRKKKVEESEVSEVSEEDESVSEEDYKPKWKATKRKAETAAEPNEELKKVKKNVTEKKSKK